MNKVLAAMIISIFISAFAYAEEAPDEQRNRENDFIKELSYRQREYQSQYIYLSEKEAKTASELNDEITTQNQTPSAISLQRIDNLRTKLMENLQDQIKNDRDYVRYLEMRLSEMVDYKFPTIKAVQQISKDTISSANTSAAPVILDQPSAPPSAVQDEPKS